MRHKGRGTRRRGFTLIEAAVATVVIGLGATALLTAVASGTRTNAAGRSVTQAVLLAQEIREWTLKLPFSDPDEGDAANPPGPDGADPQVFVDDLDDLMNVTYCPPRDGQGQPVADMTGWQQAITLTCRAPADLTTAVTPGTSDTIRVQVDISHNGLDVLTTKWLVTRRD